MSVADCVPFAYLCTAPEAVPLHCTGDRRAVARVSHQRPERSGGRERLG